MDATTLVENCYNALPPEMRNRPWEYTDHGRKVLTNDEELNAYLAAYGEIHIVKCRAALQNFPFDDLQMYAYEIFDWGCGQGIATLTLLDMLRERNKLSGLKKITLVEPSLPALTRAKQWAEMFAGPGVEIVALNKFIPSSVEEKMDEALCKTQVSINLMSNILDIKSLSLKWMAEKTSSLAARNYMVCVGPKFSQGTNTRINDFCGYFNHPDFFSAISTYPYAYTTKTHHPFGCETRCFMHQRGNELNNSYLECSNEPLFSDDYASECMRGIVSDLLLNFYNKIRVKCANSYTIFLRPAINTDTADIVLASPDKGIVLINICENLDDFEVEYRRIENIKSRLFDTHLKSIKKDSVVNKSVFNCVKTGLYFPKISKVDVDNKLAKVNKERNEKADAEQGRVTKSHNENKTLKDKFAFLIKITDDFDWVETLLKLRSRSFRYDYYDELVRIITGNWHSYNDGDKDFRLTPRQKDIVRSHNLRIRIKGVAGCGKTQIVANRAVEQHLRTGEKVLIITFNLSLIQYIRMRINQVPADFSKGMFKIANYHQFFKSMADRYAHEKLSLEDWDRKNFFEEYKENLPRYRSIVIDEVQDFKEEWLYTIITYFLEDNGFVSVFGDGEQNIFDRKLEDETKMPTVPTFRGTWGVMNERVSMRIKNPQIANLSSKFAKTFVSPDTEPLQMQENLFDEFFVKYWNVGRNTAADKLAGNIKWIIENYKLKEKDVAVLAGSINVLRDISYSYRNGFKQGVMSSFETKEEHDNVVQPPNRPTFIKKDLDAIRRAYKTHFTTDCEFIKMSTIHSFKGWEADNVILILQSEIAENEENDGYEVVKRENNPALIYTALTRARCNLFIINLGNSEYDDFFAKNIKNNS